MWIWLNKNGQVQQYLMHGPSPVVGETNFQIFAYFNELDTDFFDYATIKFRKPDLNETVYNALGMRIVDMTYHHMEGDGDTYFVEGQVYKGFLFDFSDFIESDEVVSLLDTPGLWEATITVLGAPSKTNISGLITFDVGRAVSDYDETELSLDQILENLVLSLQAIPKGSTLVVKHTNNFAYQANAGILDALYFTLGSIVFDDKNKNLYKITSVTVNDEDNSKVYASYNVLEREAIQKFDLTTTNMTFNELKTATLSGSKTKSLFAVQTIYIGTYYEFLVELDSGDNISAYDILNNTIYRLNGGTYDTSYYFNYLIANGQKNRIALSKYVTGQVIVPLTPVDSDDATSKQYVDSGLNTKVDKSTNDLGFLVYRRDNGSEGTTNATPNSFPNTIVIRDSNSNFKTSSPVDIYDAANKQYADTKVAKSNRNDGYFAYVRMMGTESVIAMSTSNNNSTLMWRDNNGRSQVTSPAQDNDIANKIYVDTLLATIKQNSFILVDTTEYPTLEDFLESDGEEGYVYLYPIDVTDTNKGYYQYITEISSDTTNWISLGTTQIDLSNYVDKQYFDENVPKRQANFVYIKDALTNINNKLLSLYEQTTITISGVNAIKITTGGNNLTKTQAADYMNSMSGSTFVPEYNLDYPINSIFIMDDLTLWKPQYDSTNGLVLLYMNKNLATKEEADSASDSYLSYAYNTNDKYYLYTGTQNLSSGTVLNSSNSHTVEIAENTSYFSSYSDDTYLYLLNATSVLPIVRQSILLSNLKIGDILFVRKQLNYSLETLPSFFVSNLIYRSSESIDVVFNSIRTAIDTTVTSGSQNAVSSDAVYNALNEKLDKITTSDTFDRVYGVTSSGTQTNFSATAYPFPENVVKRDSNGKFYVTTPTSNDEPANKEYVDTQIGSAIAGVYKIKGSASVSTLNGMTKASSVNGFVYNMTDDGTLTNSSGTIDVVTGDNVVFVWDDGNWYWDKLTGAYDLSTKLDKVTTPTTKSQVYTKTATGSQTMTDMDSNSSAGSVMIRDINGRSKVEDPVADKDIANKEYVDNGFDDLKNDLQYGNISVRATTAKQIEPISDEAGTIQEVPFIMQGTGTANNTDSVDTSPVGKQLEKQGNSVVVNQLVKNGNFANVSNWTLNSNTTYTVSNNVATIINTSGTYNGIYQNLTSIASHKYLIYGYLKTDVTPSQDSVALILNAGTSTNVSMSSNTNWQFISFIVTATSTSGYVKISLNYWENKNVYAKEIIVVDLTKWFGSNDLIPQDLLDNPSHFSWYYNGSLAYNTGELVNCSGKYLVNSYRNQWDEETRNGYYGIDGLFNANSSYIANKNPIKVIPNTDYYWFGPSGKLGRYCWYDKDMNFISTGTRTSSGTITSPANAIYLNFDLTSSYGTTYKHDITISLYYTTGDGYTEYYPYQAPKVYDTGSEVLRSVGSVKDVKIPDGTITRNVSDEQTLNIDNIGETSSTYSNIVYYTISKPSNMLGYGTYGDVLISNNKGFTHYTTGTESVNNAANIGKYLTTANPNKIWFGFAPGTTLNQAKTALGGMKWYYPLATPTTEQGTPFSENIEIDDYGTMSWMDDLGQLISVPQGTKLFYPADYVNLVDSLNNYTNGDVTKLSLKSETYSKTETNTLLSEKQNVLTFDDTPTANSNNPVKSGGVYNSIQDINEKLEYKANVDGNYPTMTAGLADNLTPYSEDSGAEQDDSFISEGTGTGNGSEIVTTGDYALLKEKQGNTLVVNQLITNSKPTSLSGWSSYQLSSLEFVDNSLLITSSTAYSAPVANIKPIIKNHKYLFVCDFKNNGNSSIVMNLYVRSNPFGGQFVIASSVSYNTLYKIITATENNNTGNALYIGNITANVNYNIKNILLIDLTQWYGSNDLIPSDLLTNPYHFSWYYNGSLAYNSGEIKNSDGVKLVSTGRNLWDEEWENGYLDSQGSSQNSTSYIRSKNFITIVPNTNYYIFIPSGVALYFTEYDKDFNFIKQTYKIKGSTIITSPNCVYMKFYMGSSYGTTYNHDITISLYYTPEQGGEGYDKYYPYEEPKVYNTGSEVLRSAGSVRDVKTPNDTIIRNIGAIDLGTISADEWHNETITLSDGTQTLAWYCAIPNALGNYETYGTTTLCSEYSNYENTSSALWVDKSLRFGNSSTNINIVNKAFNNYIASQVASALNGVMLNYVLATPTTEQGTSFSENLQINDYGMLYWLDSDNELVDIPQGNKIFYPVNYKGFIDDVYARTEGDASKLALESEITDSALNARGYYKMQDLSSGITDAAGLTYDLKKAYKQGNVVTLTIRAKNDTGSQLAIGTTLFNLSSGLIPNTGLRFIAYINDMIANIYASNSGGCNASIVLPNGQYIIVCVSYAVA